MTRRISRRPGRRARCCLTTRGGSRPEPGSRLRLAARPFRQFPPTQLQQPRAEQDTLLVPDLNGQNIVGRGALPDERSGNTEIRSGRRIETLGAEIVDPEPAVGEARL